MINSSFINIPQIQDQDILTIKNPLPINDAVRFQQTIKNSSLSLEELAIRNYEIYNKQPTGSVTLDKV